MQSNKATSPSRRIAVAAAAMLTLAACGQSTNTGTSAGSSEGVQASDAAQLQQLKSLQVSKNAATNISFPAAGVIVSALSGTMQPGLEWRHIAQSQHILATVGNLRLEQIVATAANDVIERYREKFAKLDSTEAAQLPRHLRQMYDARSDPQRFEDEALRFAVAEMIVAVAQPIAGWPVNVMSRSQTSQQLALRFIAHVQSATELSTLLLAEVAAQVAAAAWRDPAAAAQAVQATWFALPPQKIRAAIAQAATLETTAGLSIDLAGARNVHWTSDAGDYVGDGAGWTVQRHGAPWSGAGYLAGRKVDIQLASAISATTSKSSSASSGTGTTAGVDASGGAQVR